MNNLESQFKKETNIDVLVPYTNEEIVYSSEYIEWLEAKINYTRCCTECSECNNANIESNYRKYIELNKNVKGYI